MNALHSICAGVLAIAVVLTPTTASAVGTESSAAATATSESDSATAGAGTAEAAGAADGNGGVEAPTDPSNGSAADEGATGEGADPAPEPTPTPDAPTETPPAELSTEEATPEAPGLAALAAAGGNVAGNFCSTGVWSLASVGAEDFGAYQVDTAGNVSSTLSGFFRGTVLDALAIKRDGTTAFTASVDGGNISIQRLSAQLGASDEVDIPTTAAAVTRFTGGAINHTGDKFFFGGFNASGAFVLYAFDIAQLAPTNTTPIVAPALLGTVTLPGVNAAGAGSDIAFAANGDLLLLWGNGTMGVAAKVTAGGLPSGGASVAATAAVTLSETNIAWNGLAFDSIGQLWVQGGVNSGADTRVAMLNAATGAVSAGQTTAGITSSDLASCGSSVTLVLQKQIVSRASTGDQFTIDVRPEGSSQAIDSATTVGTATTAQVGPVQVTPGASYSIGEVGAPGTSLKNYNIGTSGTFSCTWSGGGTIAPAFGTVSGRAQAKIDIPGDGSRDGQALTCVIRNEAKQAAQQQPKIELRKFMDGARKTASDVFNLRIGQLNSTVPLASAAASSPATGAQTQFATAVAESGTSYTISEVDPNYDPAGATPSYLASYTATYVCVWAGAPALPEFARGALSFSNGRMQAALPAIPSSSQYLNRTLSCTITNKVAPASGLDCSVSTVYVHYRPTANSPGDAYRVTMNGRDTTSAVNFNAAPVSSSSFNALALNRDGSIAMVSSRISDTQVRLRTWSSATNSVAETTHIRVTGTTPAIPTTIVGGAIDPTNGDYYFGGYANGTFNLFVLRSGTGNVIFVRSIGVKDAAASPNGDITFDANGNLYLVASVSGNHRLARVNAADVVVSATAINATELANWNTTTNSRAYNGVAFSGDGNLWVSWSATNTGGIDIINPSTGATLGTAVTGQTGFVDLASCGMPPTMRLQKQIDGPLVHASDTFRISIYSGSTESQFNNTVANPSEGVQPQAAGPMVVTVGQQYRIQETITAGNARARGLDDYLTGFSCTWSDMNVPIASGVLQWTTTDGGTRRFADLPAIPAGKQGQQLNCTITNAQPLQPSVVTSRKLMADARGLNPVGQAGWQMNSQIVAGTPAGVTIVAGSRPILDPYATPNDQLGEIKTTGSSGSVPSPWQLRFTTSRDTAALRLWESGQPGYQFQSGSCTVTPRFGTGFTVNLTPETIAGLSAGSVTITGGTDQYGNPVNSQPRNLRAGDRVECTFQNKPNPGSVTWQKVDSAGSKPHLAGSAWSLTGPGVPPGEVIVDCVNSALNYPTIPTAKCTEPTGNTSGFFDADPRPGYFLVENLSLGNHRLVEQTPPPGFALDTTPHRFIIDLATATCSSVAGNSAFVPKCRNVSFDPTPFENSRRQMPGIPLTGGLGTLIFTIGSGALVALGLMAAWWHQRRRRASQS